MARYAPEFMDNIRRPRPLAHIRDPHNLHRSRQHRDFRPDGRDRNLDRIGDGAVEVRIVNDIIDDHPDHPININFNYGPVHFHQTCGCPNPAAHTCMPIPTPGGGRGGRGGPSRRNTLTYRDPPYPSDRDSPSPRPPHRPRPPPSNPPPPPRLRSILRNRDASGPVNPRAVVAPSSGSSSSSSSASFSSDLDDSETTTRVRRTTTTTTVVVGICDGCLTRQRLVADGLCAECAYFARDAPPPPPSRPGTGAGAGGVSLYSGRPRPAPRPRSMGAWGGGGLNGGNGVGVRYVPVRGEDADVAAARREVRERERWREAELEMRERDRERERERERERDGGRRGVRWVREAGVRDSGSGRERRYYPGGSAGGAYYTESDLDDW